MTRLLALILLLLPALAQANGAIVYLGVEDDPYYEPQKTYTGLSLRDRPRPTPGAQVAMREAQVLARALGIKFALEEILLPDDADVVETVGQHVEQGALAILLDLPLEDMAAVIAAYPTSPTTLFNIRDSGRRWRAGDCAPSVLHTIPSYDMLADALGQHLRKQGWERILLLSGQAPGDGEQADAARRAIRKFGLKLADARQFELSNDPRERDLNNIRLLTGGVRYDVIWLVDSEGEFGRYVPYSTYDPRPVVGSEGLTPVAWHWTFERYGAPQLNQRFRRMADHDMSDGDWAAWAAVRAVIESVQRTGSTDPAEVGAYLRSDALSLDLYKGVAGSFRPWNGQLRQPILVATHNAVIAQAPLEGFEHQTDTLDTLGQDEPESECSLK